MTNIRVVEKITTEPILVDYDTLMKLFPVWKSKQSYYNAVADMRIAEPNLRKDFRHGVLDIGHRTPAIDVKVFREYLEWVDKWRFRRGSN